MTTVHVIGGGMGGLSVAHELVGVNRRLGRDQFEVHVYDRLDRWGGKSESQFAGPERWPGEHGFRYFPHFYRCMVPTLGEVPFTDEYARAHHLRPSPNGYVSGLLQESTQGAIAFGGKLHVIPRTTSPGPRETRDMIAMIGGTDRDAVEYSKIMLRFMTTCDARALQTYEHQGLREVFGVGTGRFTPPFEAYLQSIRGLSAMRSDAGSARSTLNGTVQLWWDFDRVTNDGIDQLLVGPTDVMMIEPWLAHLRDWGVELHARHALDRLRFAGHDLREAVLVGPGGELVLRPGADEYVVACVPLEVMQDVLGRSGDLPPVLDDVLAIERGTEPMTGLQFFLSTDVPLCDGHVHFADTPWALTCVSQAQFWTRGLEAGRSLAEHFGIPNLRGILSVIVSAWDEPGNQRHRKPAEACTKQELIEEVWAQMRAALGTSVRLDEASILHVHVDEQMQFPPGGLAYSQTPLFVSPRGSYLLRPMADSGFDRFFLAADWVRTETDLASMESANEAARLAVRGILDRAGVPAALAPTVPPFRLWAAMTAAREVDGWLYERGYGHLFDLLPGQLGVFDLLDESMTARWLARGAGLLFDALQPVQRARELVEFVRRSPVERWDVDAAQRFWDVIRRR